MEMARSMMKNKQVPDQLWAEAVATAVYLLNRAPTKAVMDQTPYQALKGIIPTVHHLRVFGCVAYPMVNSQQRRKLDPKSERCVFIGYCPASRAYKLLNPITNKLQVSRNVWFDEEASWDWSENKDGVQKLTFEGLEESTREDSPAEISQSNIQNTPEDSPRNTRTSNETVEEQDTPLRYRSLNDIYNSCTYALTVADPSNYNDASKQP